MYSQMFRFVYDIGLIVYVGNTYVRNKRLNKLFFPREIQFNRYYHYNLVESREFRWELIDHLLTKIRSGRFYRNCLYEIALNLTIRRNFKSERKNTRVRCVISQPILSSTTLYSYYIIAFT